jgi:hypothetical protein
VPTEKKLSQINMLWSGWQEWRDLITKFGAGLSGKWGI